MTLRLVRKYTGHDITDDAIAAARQASGTLPVLAAAIVDTCYALTSTEANLARCADTIAGHLADVRRALSAGPDEPAPTLDPLGVLQAYGPRLTALTVQRATQISHLHALAQIWLAHQPHQPPAAGRAEQARHFAERIVAAIDEDISAGTVPGGIGSFVDLHRYVDANDYLIVAGVPYDGTADSIDVAVAVQGLVVASLRTPGRPFCTHGTCRFAAHDHTTSQGPDGADLDAAVPLRCRHCDQPAHYDRRLEEYRHDDPAAPDCFLVDRDD
ncbi:hypothetical protein OG992_33150 [Micromonospora sp. NBC_00362]|uniref:hypothetical protein n=1 Tax=Micromonospora sp. NBC_00362 TaxID=2975975 RepID=UPI002254E8EF|nr:hypothetical protein [Micromonospora sp. NBC_00362]MCX5122013.1 hypothetical protein [Micromonospora sp. NBC_00362]